jgi:hypothetical protein
LGAVDEYPLDIPEAIGILIDALEIARSQGAVAWELKARFNSRWNR